MPAIWSYLWRHNRTNKDFRLTFRFWPLTFDLDFDFDFDFEKKNNFDFEKKNNRNFDFENNLKNNPDFCLTF